MAAFSDFDIEEDFTPLRLTESCNQHISYLNVFSGSLPNSLTILVNQ